ncbi:MAG: molecular chaperone DnaJ [Rhodospirillaceae bacterium]|nr:molecular chaperone DnaJ [Rhodospirillaceae bacterium]MBT7361295.1 molecular chaperone DnaJ [Rhodospirillaceae bacterium]
MADKDFYQTLGVDRGADAATLKSAYRKLAKELHPDRNPDNADAERQFKEINQAYDILKDDDKRAAYDRYGHEAFEGGAGGPGGGQGGGGFDFSGGGFADIFDEMFGMGGRGGGGRRQASTRGSDLRYNLDVNLEDAFAGKQTRVRVNASAACDSCHGSGAAGGADPVGCPSCQGAGKVRAQQGFFTVERTCPTCHGAGRVVDNPCGVCSGAGRMDKEKTLSVNVPAGIEDGTRIRVAGEGEAGLRGGPPGDLYIFVTIRPHRFFRRDGADIQCRVPIPMTTASLGGSIEVPTIDGARARVNIPAGTQTGQQFRLRSKGMSVLRANARGDMYVQAQIETPVDLTKDQRDLLKQFEDAGGGSTKHSPESEGFFTKVKEFWDDLKD